MYYSYFDTEMKFPVCPSCKIDWDNRKCCRVKECWYYKPPYVPKRSYLYLTLSPDKFLRNLLPTQHNIDALKKWADNWFGYNIKHYKGYLFTLESGSKGDHLHLHAICEMKTSHKHAEQLKKSWAKTFPNNQLVTTVNLQNKGKKGEYAYLQINDPKILQDKIDYFDNCKKGIHANLLDLKISGQGGSLTYMNK